MRALLDAAEAAPPAEAVDALAAELAAEVGPSEVSRLMADNSGRTLARLARRSAQGLPTPLRPAGANVQITGTPAGTALSSQRTQVSHDRDGVWLHVPVSERGEALGVLELLLHAPPSADTVDYLGAAARALAHVIVADRRFSDLYELGQRDTLLSLEAEIQRRLLPPSYACEGPQFALAGWLVPADQAGGDTFDYMVDRSTLHLSITDAVGHGGMAAQLATLGVASLRNSRRRGLGLTEQAQQANADDWPPVGAERVWAVDLGDDRYRIDDAPWFVRTAEEHRTPVPGQRRRRAQDGRGLTRGAMAEIPVTSRPTIRACTESVPSKVKTASMSAW